MIRASFCRYRSRVSLAKSSVPRTLTRLTGAAGSAFLSDCPLPITPAPFFPSAFITLNRSCAILDFSTKAFAPASTATFCIRTGSFWLTIITSDSGTSRRMIRVASIPSIRGMETSMSTTSGHNRFAFSIASTPSLASPQTDQGVLDANKVRTPFRTAS